MKKNLLSILAMAVVFTGCSDSDLIKTDESETETSGQVEINARATTQLSVEAETKAPFEGTINADHPLKAHVLVSQTSNDYSSLWSEGDMNFTNTNAMTPFEGNSYRS